MSLETIYHIYDRILTGLISCLSCTGNHGCYEFLSTIALPCPKPAFHSVPSPPPALTSFPFPLHDVPWAAEGSRCWQRWWPWDWALSVHLGALTYYTSLCWLLPTAKETKVDSSLIYGYQNKYSEVSLTAWPFSKITVAGSTLGPLTSPAMWFWSRLQYKDWETLPRNRLKIHSESG